MAMYNEQTPVQPGSVNLYLIYLLTSFAEVNSLIFLVFESKMSFCCCIRLLAWVLYDLLVADD